MPCAEGHPIVQETGQCEFGHPEAPPQQQQAPPGGMIMLTNAQLTTMITAAVTTAMNATAGAAAGRVSANKAQRIDRPKITQGLLEESWNTIIQWEMYKTATGIAGDEISRQLVYCCEGELMELVLRADRDLTSKPENEILTTIKGLAVIPVAIGVRRSEMLAMGQDRSEPVRAFASKVKGKSATCDFSIIYSSWV